MPEEKMTLVDRLYNPAWEHGEHFESPQLAKAETRADMEQAANILSSLREAAAELISASDDYDETEAAEQRMAKAIETARAAITQAGV